MGTLSLLIVFTALVWVVFDAIAGARSYKYRNIDPELGHRCEDYQILVPIYGNMKYLENIEYLLQYREKVLLCTSSGQTTTFYEELEEVIDRYGFGCYQSPYEPPTVTRKRATGGATRDNVIKDALLNCVTAEYVICIDADTETPQSLDLLIGELQYQQADLASIRLVPQTGGPMFVQLQRHEYRLAMRLRFLFPWLVSGACHAGRSDVMRQIMSRHSLFFQGNDVETGLLGEQLSFKVVHIPFDVATAVPATFRGWWRQRLAWSGGEFRLFIINIRYVTKHPFFWLYGGLITIVFVIGRWYTAVHPTWALLIALAVYCTMIYGLHWRTRNRWLILMPLYTLVIGFVLVPLGIWKYFAMVEDGNFGVIRAKQQVERVSR